MSSVLPGEDSGWEVADVIEGELAPIETLEEIDPSLGDADVSQAQLDLLASVGVTLRVTHDENGEIIPANLPERTPRQVWAKVFTEAFFEAKHVQPAPRTLAGPMAADITAVLEETSDRLLELDPSYTPEYIMPDEYRSPSARLAMNQIFKDRKDHYVQIYEIREAKLSALRDLAFMRYEETAKQELPAGRLTVPPFIKQRAHQDCALSAFAMVVQDLISEDAYQGLYDGLSNVHGTGLMEDETYLKMLQSDAIRRKTGIEVQTLSMFGADIGFVDKITEKIKERIPEARIYCVLSLVSNGLGARAGGVWHNNILLDATGRHINVHDPKHRGEMEYGKPDFTTRWTQAYGRCHLVIVEPDGSNQGEQLAEQQS